MFEKSFLEVVIKSAKSPTNSYADTMRYLGALEIILLVYGKLKVGGTLPYKTITYEVKTFFGKTKIRTRSQKYSELIIGLSEELLNEIDDLNENFKIKL